MANPIKTQKVIEYITANYPEHSLSGWFIWKLSEELQTSPSTIYRAIRKLRDMGALNSDNAYVGRNFVKPEEIVPFAANDMILFTDKKYEELSKVLFATRSAIWAGIRWGLMCGYFKELNGGFYGYLLHVEKVA